MTDWVDDVIQRVAEIPYRTGPEDQPDIMLVTAASLREAIETVLLARAERPATPAKTCFHADWCTCPREQRPSTSTRFVDDVLRELASHKEPNLNEQ